MTELTISKPSRKRRNREQWMQLVAGHSESGLGVGSYCERERVSAASFYRWRALVAGDVARARATKVVHQPKARAEDFVDLGMMNPSPLTTEQDATTRRGERLELRLELGAGIVLTVSRS